MRSAAKKKPAQTESVSSRRVRGPSRRRSIHARIASGGTAYAQRKTAAVAGATSASRTRIAEKAIVSAPATATRPGWRDKGPTSQSSQALRCEQFPRLVVRRRRRDVGQRRVLVLRLREVAERDDANRLAVLDHGQPADV